MHGLRALVCLLAVAWFFLPSAAAQHPAGHTSLTDVDSTIRIVDAPADVGFFTGSKAQPQPQNASQVPANFDHIDILGLVFGQETESEFRVELALKSLTSSNPTGFFFRQVTFSYGRVNWRLFVGPCSQRLENPGLKACLSYGDSGRGMRPVQEFTYEVKDTTITFPVQKAWLYNENRVPPRFGTQLTNLSAYAVHWYGGLFFPPPVVGDPVGGFYAVDRAPNSGPYELPFTMSKGSNAHGHLSVDSADPIRVSNGEATTIVYKINVLNHHTEPLKASLEAIGVPAAWSVRVPALVTLDPQSTTVLPVILSVPFTHEHGKTFTFDVKAQAVEDAASWGQAQLGIYWTEIPQPSAHHETEDGGTFFHSARIANERVIDQAEDYIPTFQMWMNGIDQDPDPSVKDENVPSVFNEYVGCAFVNNVNCGVPPESSASWFFPLSPQLLMGLDFDLSREGQARFDILPKVASPAARAIVKLVYCDPATGTGSRTCLGNQTQMGGGGGGICPSNYNQLIAQGERTGALSANTPTTFEVPLAVDPKWDLLPYTLGANIGLCVTLKSQVPQNAVFVGEPRAMPEFVVKTARLRLPLIEYHDPIDQAFVNVGALNLVSKDPFEKQINPGRAGVFHFELKTNSSQPLPVRLELQGVNSEWASIVGTDRFELAPGAPREVLLVVRVPDDAQPEERAELFLVATSERDASVVTVSRLRGTVVTTPDIPDELSQIEGLEAGDKSPAPGGLLVGGAVGAAALLWRRRRQ